MSKTCQNCGRTDGAFTGLVCAACYQFKKRTGRDRPYRGDGRKEGCPRGEKHYAWKGDAAAKQTKRDRAKRLYPLGACEECGEPATDRHHRDGDTGNNRVENIARVCRRCHMKLDGRLEQFIVLATVNSQRKKKTPEPCVNCGRLAKPRRKGRCYACDMFFRRHNREWTKADAGTKPRLAKALIAGECGFEEALGHEH